MQSYFRLKTNPDYLEDDYEAPPSEPGHATPGSRAKIELMRARYERGEQIFHRDDRTNDDVVGGPICNTQTGHYGR